MPKVKSKLFSEDQLRAVSKILGNTDFGLTNTEIDDLLHICKVPDEMGPGTKWRRILVNLYNHQIRRNTRTNAIEFIRQAMKPARHLGNPDRFKAMRSELNTALSFAGLMVLETGEVKSAKVATTIEEAERRAAELKEDLQTRGVHPDVIKFCRAELLADDYFHAVQEAVKSVFDKLRLLSGQAEDGGALINEVLASSSPAIRINKLSTESEKSEQRGFANLLKGTYGMFRNPTAHEARIKWSMTKADAEDLLSLVSLIHRRLDASHASKRSI
ncbi:TIGR02391 family protein [Anderseniella sp. Alg231-50]|uniref:TIGR02391 family protein n=1 Tax=Anderseniella sp. Alg231-50 TaxID=1922226 RepID=UPI000D5534D3